MLLQMLRSRIGTLSLLDPPETRVRLRCYFHRTQRIAETEGAAGCDNRSTRMGGRPSRSLLMTVPCIVRLDFAGGTGHRWTVGLSLPAPHSYRSRTTAKSDAKRSFRRPPASGGQRHDRALGTTEEADNKSVEANLHGELGRFA